MALRTPTKDAEEIKVEYGVAKQLLADPSENLEVPGLGDRAPRMLSRQALAGVIEPRIEEIFSLVHQVIRDSGYEELLSSAASCISGGSAVMPGMVELGEDIFLKPVRRGIPPLRRRAVRHGGQPALGHRDGPARRGAPGAHARAQGGGQGRLGEDRARSRARTGSWGISDDEHEAARRGPGHSGDWQTFFRRSATATLTKEKHHGDRNDRRIRPRHQDQGHRRRRRRRQRRRAHDRQRRAGRGVRLRQHRRAGAQPQRCGQHPAARQHRAGRGRQARGRQGRGRRGRTTASARPSTARTCCSSPPAWAAAPAPARRR